MSYLIDPSVCGWKVNEDIIRVDCASKGFNIQDYLLYVGYGNCIDLNMGTITNEKGYAFNIVLIGAFPEKKVKSNCPLFFMKVK